MLLRDALPKEEQEEHELLEELTLSSSMQLVLIEPRVMVVVIGAIHKYSGSPRYMIGLHFLVC